MKQMQSACPVVLVIDDNPAMRTMIRVTLEMAGMTVFGTDVGPAAVALFEQHASDLVLLDIVMPDMKGLETCSRIRSLPRGNRVPVLIMTEHGDGDSIAMAYEHGATAFITKPINPMILLHHARYMLRAKNVLEALIKSEARLELAQRIARIGNWDWEPRRNRFSMSHQLCQLVGVRPQDFGGTIEDFLALVHPDDRASVKQALTDIPDHHRPCDMDHRVVLRNGVDFTVHLQAEGVRDEQTHEFMVIGTAQDITERKQAERAIHRLAYYDGLTGLANRILFNDRLSTALSHAKRYRTHLAILFIDLDRFKLVNDTLGHTVGDLLLKHMAERLSDSVRQSDSISRSGEPEPSQALARLGGDEFTILLTDLVHPEDAVRVSRRILESFARPFLIDAHEIFISASVGISIYPSDGETAEALLKNADTAMYHAKEQGRSNCQFYSTGLNAAASERLDVENHLRMAIENREFLIYYQAKVDVRSRRITGAEALLRWKHPRRGILSPAHFLPAAIDTGLIRPIDEWVLREACLQSKRWQAAGLAPITVSVNVSNSLYHGSTLVPTASKALSESGLASQYLELEVTEAIAMRDMDTSITMLEDLKRIGIRLSVDDFGTGYSSLSDLQRLPLSRLKIDQSFVRNLVTDEHNEKIVRAIIALAHGFTLPVLAEGVETEAQFRKLEREGCDEVQGYLFSRPTNAEEFERFLRRDADSRKVA